MSVAYYKEFGKFCSSFHIDHIENGYLKGNDWQHNSLKAPYNRLYIILDGQGTVYLEDRTELLEKGYAYIVPAGMDFRCDSPVFLEKLFLHFITDSFNNDNPFKDSNRLYKMAIDPTIYKAVVEAFDENKPQTFFSTRWHYESLIYRMIETLLEDGDLTVGKMLPREMQQLYDLMEQNLSAKLRTAWLAEQTGMSQSGLSKYYRSMTGTTLKNTIRERLMKKAQIMLLTTEKSIQEIALELGYEDTLYLTKVFKKMVGMPPTQYRKENITY